MPGSDGGQATFSFDVSGLANDTEAEIVPLAPKKSPAEALSGSASFTVISLPDWLGVPSSETFDPDTARYTLDVTSPPQLQFKKRTTAGDVDGFEVLPSMATEVDVALALEITVPVLLRQSVSVGIHDADVLVKLLDQVLVTKHYSPSEIIADKSTVTGSIEPETLLPDDLAIKYGPLDLTDLASQSAQLTTDGTVDSPILTFNVPGQTAPIQDSVEVASGFRMELTVQNLFLTFGMQFQNDSGDVVVAAPSDAGDIPSPDAPPSGPSEGTFIAFNGRVTGASYVDLSGQRNPDPGLKQLIDAGVSVGFGLGADSLTNLEADFSGSLLTTLPVLQTDSYSSLGLTYLFWVISGGAKFGNSHDPQLDTGTSFGPFAIGTALSPYPPPDQTGGPFTLFGEPPSDIGDSLGSQPLQVPAVAPLLGSGALPSAGDPSPGTDPWQALLASSHPATTGQPNSPATATSPPSDSQSSSGASPTSVTPAPNTSSPGGVTTSNGSAASANTNSSTPGTTTTASPPTAINNWPPATTSSPPLTSTDPVFAAATADVSAALNLWQQQLAFPDTLSIDVQVGTLAGGELAESALTRFDASGQPTGGVITIDPNANGRGWYLDANPLSNRAYSISLAASAFVAVPGSPAARKYDLFTAILHEIGHLEGLIHGFAGFDQHLVASGGNEQFVGASFSALLSNDGSHLDSQAQPYDLMNASLAPGVRKLPSALDAQILDTARSGSWSQSINSASQSLTAALHGDDLADSSDLATGWTIVGTGSFHNGIAVLNDDPTFLTELLHTITVPDGVSSFTFTITHAQFGANGSNPPHAFEAALLNAGTGLPVVGSVIGLTQTDSF